MLAKTAVALTESVKHVFETMMGASVRVAKPVQVTAGSEGCDISAVIGLSGNVAGAVTIGMSMDSANAIARAFAGFESDPPPEDLADAIGELANMITGNAKSRLNTDGISITVPSVVIGPKHLVSSQRDMPIIALPCSCDLGSFTIRLALRPAPSVAAAS